MSQRVVAGRAASGWAAALVLGLAVVSGCAGPSSPEAAKPAPTRTSTPASTATPTLARGDGAVDQLPLRAQAVLRCGQSFHRAPAPQLVVSGQFPASVVAGEQSLVGRVRVSARAGGVAGVVTPAADVFLVRANRVATLPVAQDSVGVPLRLNGGYSHEFTARAALTSCDPSLPDQALSPGRYDVYARVTVNREDGSRVESFGGPWPLEIQ
ncbi:MAG: hypothetical protein ACJ71T_16635 [Actinomycetales bacterium]